MEFKTRKTLEEKLVKKVAKNFFIQSLFTEYEFLEDFENDLSHFFKKYLTFDVNALVVKRENNVGVILTFFANGIEKEISTKIEKAIRN